MSESTTTEETEPTVTPEPVGTDTPAPTTETPPAQATETVPADTEGDKPRQGDRRFAVLTAKAAYDRQRAEAAERDLAETKARLALLEAAKPTPEGDAPPKPPEPATDVELRARQLIAEREAEQRRLAVVQDGMKAFGEAGWNEKTTTLADLGALNAPGFMEALIEMPNAPQIVAALADDPNRLAALITKRPTALAAELGRLSAELAAPKPRAALSAVGEPVRPVSTRGTTPAPDVTKMSAKEFIEYRNKTAPSRLGGPRRKTA